MSRPRVLYVVHGHPEISTGGVEVYALELYEAMRKAGAYEPILLARTPASAFWHPGARLSTLGADPHQYLMTTDPAEFDFFHMRSRTPDIRETFREFLRETKPSVVHFQHTLFTGVELIRETRNTLPEVPILYTLHEFLPICHRQGQLVRVRDGSRCLEASPRRCTECFPGIAPAEFFLRRKFIESHFACVDRFLTPSEFARRRFIDWGIPEEKIRFEENGRNLPLRPAVESEREARTRLAYFGQVHPFKGVTVLLKAMGLLRRNQSRGAPTLRIHGANLENQEETLRTEFHKLLAEAGNLVHFAGPYRREEVASLMREIDWVVIPSIWWENSPLVIQEAFAAGRPVICSDIGGMAEKVTDGVDGLHFRAGDPLSLAETIERASGSPELWNRLRSGIRPPYEIGRHVEVMGRSYDELVSRRRLKEASVAA